MKKSNPSIAEREKADLARADRRADAIFNFVKSLADAGDERAVAFLNKMLSGGFDWPEDEPGESCGEKHG